MTKEIGRKVARARGNRRCLGPFLPRSAAIAFALSLAACNTEQVATGSIKTATDVRQRHPIVLTEAPRFLDVFVGGAFRSLDDRQRAEVAGFARDYVSSGKGHLAIMAPEGVRYERDVEHTVQAIRHVLAQSRIPAAAVVVKSYRPADPSISSPIRLSYDALQAKLASQCGQWPDDLGGITYVKDGWDNHAYWNLGCAWQANIVAQVNDPRDLVRARPEDPVDTVQRMNRIGKVRESQDPTTIFTKNATKIDTTVGGQ